MSTLRIDWPKERGHEAPDEVPRATDPAARERWSRLFSYLREQAATADPLPFARELAEQARRFETAIYPTQREVLSTTLLWNEAEHAFVQWVQSGYHSLARTAAEALKRADLADAVPGGAAGALAALALAGYGNAIKWTAIAEGERDAVSLVDVKRAWERAENAGLASETHVVPHGERDATVTLEALFIRAMLLDAICRGNLGPRQVEIIDSWLWEWTGEYRLAGTVDGAVLAYEQAGERGLRTTHGVAGSREGKRYVWVEPLERQIAGVVRGFREGSIFPGYGCAAEFRVEEHTAALDFLRFFFEATRNHVARQKRERREDKVEAFAGLAEILAKAFAPRAIALATRAPSGPRPASLQAPGIDTLFDIPRRWMRVLDESRGGLGVEYREDAIKPIEVGMLVSIHYDDSPRPVLCEVMRRSTAEGRKVRLGLRILTREPTRLFLARPGTDKGLEAIYLPGREASGHLDTLLVAEPDFTVRERFEVGFDDRAFVIRMNRARYHGRGWFLAGFEVEEEMKKPSSPGAPGHLALI
jgi:hypothetical protein